MRREGRIHGYEFDRLRRESEYGGSRVKAPRAPTNRSKFGGPGTPVHKSLKKSKGFRNKKADVSIRDWSFRSSPGGAAAPALSLSIGDEDHQPALYDHYLQQYDYDYENDHDHDHDLDKSLPATSSAPLPIVAIHLDAAFPPLISPPSASNYDSDASDWFDVAKSDDSDADSSDYEHVGDEDWYLL